MKALELIVLSIAGAFIANELQTSKPRKTIVNTTPNAQALPVASVDPSTLTQMQLGSGLFGNPSGLETSP